MLVLRTFFFMVVTFIACYGRASCRTGPDAYSRQEVVEFVDSAVTYAKAAGRTTALRHFNGPDNKFKQDGLYVFAIDYSGVVLAHGGDPLLVGKNLFSLKDRNGVYIIRELIKRAMNGHGWVAYIWHNPAHRGALEPKFSYVHRVDDVWFIGAGSYGVKSDKMFRRPTRGFR